MLEHHFGHTGVGYLGVDVQTQVVTSIKGTGTQSRWLLWRWFIKVHYSDNYSHW